jgi:hypothetical protein
MMSQAADVYLICSVRKATPEQIAAYDSYVAELERKGCKVHYPPRDVEQDDPTGLAILFAHKDVMRDCKEVHAFWSPESEGSVNDLGMALMADKPIKLVNKKVMEEWLAAHPGKSFTRVVYELDKIYQERIRF